MYDHMQPYGNNDDKSTTHYDIANVAPNIIEGSVIIERVM